MSVEDDVELRDLVAQTLELNGCLPKIRAQLRASIFLALDENEEVQKKEPLQNKKIKTHLDSKIGRAMFCVVREFLEFFNLDFTISVYEPESYLGTGYQYTTRSQIIKDLGISQLDETSTVPLLHQLIELAQLQNKVIDINLNKIPSETQPTAALNETFNVTTANELLQQVKNKDDSNSECNSSIAEEIGKDTQSISENEFSPPILKDAKPHGKNDAVKLSPQKTDKIKTKSLSSLADLPPLQLSKSRNDTVLLPSLYSKEFKVNQNSKEIDKIFDVDLDSYEEDFMSDTEMNLNKTYVEEQADNGSSQRSDTNEKETKFDADLSGTSSNGT
ncbi:hypothetical protein RN001_015378 [Aquatica leii]|uniref:FGFR1 oncogene partner (FOP) N-terminal dimerisation domain-containing protein n=1 Tax=Aquatica leii TaxID=1421715 RepID=A0AAN7PPK9_9COLE|nr:hypothetical protein RN001_015378 [Aquatica leii]